MHICSMFHVCTCFSLQGILQGCNQMCAGYLFQQDKQYDVSYDTGDKAIQCGRHVDIFKFWLMWKAKVNHKSPLKTSEVIYLVYTFNAMEGFLNTCVNTTSKHTDTWSEKNRSANRTVLTTSSFG